MTEKTQNVELLNKFILMENNPIQMLMNEHKIISATEEIISNLKNTWKNNNDRYKNSVNKLLVFFREYSDQFHHRKEEEVLFRELKNNPDFHLDAILTELEEHHEMFRSAVKEIEVVLNAGDFEKVQSLLSDYINNLLDHIAVENDELFVMAESLFNKYELERIYFLFQDIDTELGGETKKQQLKNSLNHLTND